MKQDFINIGFEAANLSLQERCEEIYRIHLVIGKSLNKYDWFFDIKKPFDLRDKEFFIQSLLKRLKLIIKKHTVFQEIPDNFVDPVYSVVSIFGSNKFDNGLIFRYILGEKSHSIKLATISIDNINDFFGTNVNSLQTLLKDLRLVVKVKRVVIPDLILSNQVHSIFPQDGIIRNDFD